MGGEPLVKQVSRAPFPPVQSIVSVLPLQAARPLACVPYTRRSLEDLLFEAQHKRALQEVRRNLTARRGPAGAALQARVTGWRVMESSMGHPDALGARVQLRPGGRHRCVRPRPLCVFAQPLFSATTPRMP